MSFWNCYCSRGAASTAVVPFKYKKGTSKVRVWLILLNIELLCKFKILTLFFSDCSLKGSMSMLKFLTFHESKTLILSELELREELNMSVYCWNKVIHHFYKMLIKV